MAKPIVIAKKLGPKWEVRYVAEGEVAYVSVFGPATIDDALTEVRNALTNAFRDDYTITGVELAAPD